MKNDIYTKFGKCWNEGDFSSFSNKLIRECTYESFDYFYKLKGRDRLVEYFTEQSKKNIKKSGEEKVNIHRGYCQKPNSMLKTIKECCIMLNENTYEPIRILIFTKKFGKITSVKGFDPKDLKSIRDIKI